MWSLKFVLLHNSNQFASAPLAHSTTLKEKYEAVKYVLEQICYDQHEWLICVDLKMMTFLLGQQSGFISHTCFLCMCESRDTAQHYTKKNWPVKNVISSPLVDRDKILFPPLHIKFGNNKTWKNANLVTDIPDPFRNLRYTWPSKCITYSQIWIVFSRIWDQWVMSRGRDSIRT